jgi:hypothetical protein
MKDKFIFLGLLLAILNISCGQETIVFINGDDIVEEPIDPTPTDGIAISPMLVGNNVWFRNPSDQVWQLTADCGTQSLRIGGNGYNDNVPSNTELINWVTKIQAMGAEPIMQVSQLAPASNAAALVKLFNIDKATGKAIKYWNIGNEPWLKLNSTPTAIAALVEPYFKERAAAMKEIDPTIKIYGPDFAYYIEPAINDLFGGKNNIAGKVPGKNYYYCDGLAWHKYPQSDAENQNLSYNGLASFENDIIKCKAKIDAVNTQLGRTGNDALGWGIGEYNAKNGTYVHRWDNGQMFAGILNLCMKYGATYATTWSMFENGGSRSGTDYSFIDGNMTPRATYRHMEMIAKNFSGTYFQGKSTKSDVIIFGSVNGGKTSVMVINRANTATNFNLNLNYDTVNTSGGIGLNVDAGSSLSYSGSIEALATHTYVFENGKITRTAYTNSDFVGQKPPVTTVL